MPTPERIINCLKRDMNNDFNAAIKYAENIAKHARQNPWADAADASNYEEAARRLKIELEKQINEKE